MRRAHLPSLLEKICWTLTGSATRHAQGTLVEVRPRVILLRAVILPSSYYEDGYIKGHQLGRYVLLNGQILC